MKWRWSWSTYQKCMYFERSQMILRKMSGQLLAYMGLNKLMDTINILKVVFCVFSIFKGKGFSSREKRKII